MKRFHEVKQSIVGVKKRGVYVRIFIVIQFQVNMIERSKSPTNVPSPLLNTNPKPQKHRYCKLDFLHNIFYLIINILIHLNIFFILLLSLFKI